MPLLAAAALAASLPSIDTPARSGASSPGDAAVVVGIEDYYQLPDVPYATRDAQAFRDLAVYTLGIPADRVSLLTGAVTRKQVTDALDRAAGLAGRDGRVWVYFAGHGMASLTGGDRILLAGDAPLDPQSIDGYAVSATEIRDAVARTGGKLFVVTDACFTGVGRDGQSLLRGKRFAVPTYATEPVSRVTEWLAASPGEAAGPLHAAGHGAFTYFAVGALRGWADGELSGTRDGKVTLDEARLYVERMLRSVGETTQTPVLSTTNAEGVVVRGKTESGPQGDIAPVVAAAARASDGLSRVAETATAPSGAGAPSQSFSERYGSVSSSSPPAKSSTTTARPRGPRHGGVGGEVMAGLPFLSSKLGYRTEGGTLVGVRCTLGNVYAGGALGSSFGGQAVTAYAQPELFVDAPVADRVNLHGGLGVAIAGDAGLGFTAGMQYAPPSGFRVNGGIAGMLADTSGIGVDFNVGWAY